MKRRFYFSIAAAIALAITGCSDNVESGGENGNQGTPIEGDAVYLALNIVTPASSGSSARAEIGDPTGGEEGDNYLTALEAENYVRSATVVLYTAPGMNATTVSNVNINTENATVVKSVYTENVKAQSGSTDYPNHDYKAEIQITTDDLTKDTPYRILVITNADVTSQFAAGAQLSTAKMREIANYRAANNTGNFIMSTHVEKNATTAGNTTVESFVTFDGTETTENNAAEATVWVERLAARIDYIGNDFGKDIKVMTKNKDGSYDDKNQLATAKLLGVAPVNVAKHSMYIFKQVTEDSNINGPITTLGDEKAIPDNTYPHLAPGANYVIEPTTSETGSKEFDNEFDKDILTTLNAATGDLGFRDFSTASEYKQEEKNSDASRILCYTGENTMGVDAQRHGISTGVIFKAKYDPMKLNVYNDADGTVTEKAVGEITNYADASGFYRVDNKIYYDLSAAEAEFIATGTDNEDTNILVWLRKNFTKNTWTDKQVSDLTTALSNTNTKDLGYLSWLSTKLSTASTLDASTMNWAAFLAENNGSFPENNSEDNKAIASLGTGENAQEIAQVEYYGTKHICYYQYWIRHANNGDSNKMGIMEFAIVRNNVYQLAVTGIDGLGMADPFDSTSKPDEGDETGLYLKVKLYVKSWVKRLNDNIILK